jgi:hypothetical protein
VLGGKPNLREGVVKHRACTDVPWLIALVAFTVLCATMIWIPSAGEGQADRFTGSSDYLLNTCPKFAAWPNPISYDIKVCVDSCDEVLASSGYAAEPKVFWCLPASGSAGYDEWFAHWEDNTMVRLMSDMYTYRQTPLVALGLTFVFILLFFIFVRLFLRLILRLLYVGLFVGTAYGGYSFMQHGHKEDPEGFYTGVAIVCIGGSFWCLIMCCWTPLMKIVKVLEKASQALMVMPQVMLCPIFTMPISGGIIFIWYAFCLLMMSASTEASSQSISTVDALAIAQYPGYTSSDTSVFKVREYDTDLQNWFWVHLFWMFWAVTYMEYFNFLIVSGCVADYFLDKELVDNPNRNEEFKKGNCMRLFTSIWRTIRYHLGTVAFASALIAAVKTIEAILLYVKKQIGDDTSNPFAKIILKITIAVVHCIKCILDRCNKNTLVVTAVCGSPFCAGCGKALSLFFNNMALMSLGTGMVMLMCLLSNICIALLSAGTAGYIFLGDSATDLNSSFMPLMSSFVLSFFVAKIVLGAWDCAATTILVCQVMLEEWYPDEVGKNLVKSANKGIQHVLWG